MCVTYKVKKIINIIVVLTLMMTMSILILLTSCNKTKNKSRDEKMSKKNIERATFLKDSLYANFYDPTNKVLTDKPYPYDSNSYAFAAMASFTGVTSVWGYGAFLSMLYKFVLYESAVNEDIGAINAFDQALEGLMYYRKDTKEGIFDGYRHFRDNVKGKTNNYGVSYDDDMWIGRDLVYMYKITKDEKYLTYAKEVADFIIEKAYIDLEPQIFIDFGIKNVTQKTKIGGFYWDDKLDALHTCSNGPAIIFLTELYKHTKNERYLDVAKKSYNFTMTLRNENGVFADNMKFNKTSDNIVIDINSIDPAVYTYNTGTPISSAVLLYEVTNDKKYLDEALSIAQAARNTLCVSQNDKDIVSYLNNGSWGGSSHAWFDSVLLNGYIDLSRHSNAVHEYVVEFDKTINYSYDNYLIEMNIQEVEEKYNGKKINKNVESYGKLMASDYANGWGTKKYCDANLLDMAAGVDVFATLAYYYATPGN